MEDLASLLGAPHVADPSRTGMQIRLACDLALICHHRLASGSGSPENTHLPLGVAQLAQHRLSLLLREMEALEQAHALAPLPSDVALDSLSDAVGALVEWTAAAGVLTPAEFSALLLHRRRFGHPWAASDCLP